MSVNYISIFKNGIAHRVRLGKTATVHDLAEAEKQKRRECGEWKNKHFVLLDET